MLDAASISARASELLAAQNLKPELSAQAQAVVAAIVEAVNNSVRFRPKMSKNDAFETFWKAYPRKVGKGAAEIKFMALHCGEILPQILEALEKQKKCVQWNRDCGQYIPHAATWINQRRWNDEPDVVLAGNVSVPAKQDAKGANTVILGKEYERIIERMRVIKSQYEAMQEWSVGDKIEFRDLKARRDELRIALGIKV